MAKALRKTPVMTAVWPHLHAPDTKFNAGGVYSTKGTPVDSNAGAKLAAEIDAAIDASVEEAKKDPKNKGKKIKRADAPYSLNEETGEYTFNFKLNATGTKKDGTTFTQAPALFDGKGNKIPAGVRIGGGSQIVVAYEISSFFTPLVGAGVTVRLKACQVLKLEQFGGNASAFGFETTDDGFDASGMEAEAPRAPRSASSAEVESSDESEGEAPAQSGADF